MISQRECVRAWAQLRLCMFVCICVCVCILQGKFEKVSTVKNDWGELKWKTVDTNGFDPFFLFLTFLPTILLSSAFDSVCLALSKWKKGENRARIMMRFKVCFYSNCECVWRNYFCYSPVPKSYCWIQSKSVNKLAA